MTREEKLWSMTAKTLQEVGLKLGLDIKNSDIKKGKAGIIEKILVAEEVNKQNKKELVNEEKQVEKIVKEVKNEKPIQKTPNRPIEASRPSEVKETPKKAGKKSKKANLKLSELTYKGETKSIKEWAAKINMPWTTLYDRVNRNGWPVDLAIETPLGQRRPKNKEV